jgi:SAM-dependent methyltransferase
VTSQPPNFKDAVRDQWTHAAVVWRQWHPKFVALSHEITGLLCDAADLRPGQQVLDLAGGTGEPGISAAAAVAPEGTVTCTDFVPEMVAAAEAHAKDAGRTNMTFRQVDAEDIPFGDASFDRVISRFGIMFPPDTAQALSEIKRVLRPGGLVAFATWQAADRNPWFSAVNGKLSERGVLTPPPPGMPTPFRFATPGSLPAALEQAGFSAVNEQARDAAFNWPGPPEEYLQFQMATLPAIRRAIEEADPALRESVTADCLAALNEHYDGTSTNFTARVFIVTASR